MAVTPFGFRIYRTVPYRRTVGGVRMSLTINDMRADPLEVTVGVTGPDLQRRDAMRVGDVLDLGAERWRVADIVVGDRGNVDFVPSGAQG